VWKSLVMLSSAVTVIALGAAAAQAGDRGLGADDMPVTTAGLWIASDNLDHAQYCGGVSLSGLCLLPYS